MAVQQVRASSVSRLYLVRDVPSPDFSRDNYHSGVECLLHLMGEDGLKLHQSDQEGPLSGPQGLLSASDVVLLKVNSQWKYRGCTNSDVLRGLIQRILDHPDGFTGEVVIIDNGQGEGSMLGDAHGFGRYPDDSVQANAQNRSHSFGYLAETVFSGHPVSAYRLDDIKETMVASSDHTTEGFRIWSNLSYPCFTTAGGTRVELREGVWDGEAFADRIRLINVPVLKSHAGCGVTGCLKSFYGLWCKGNPPRQMHYAELGEICGDMISRVCTPVLNILDCIWVSLHNHYGYPDSNNSHTNRLVASQDPVAADYWASKYILYPVSGALEHHPELASSSPGSNLDEYLAQAERVINSWGGIHGQLVTCDEKRMCVSAGRPD